jgi:hypothetical protein
LEVAKPEVARVAVVKGRKVFPAKSFAAGGELGQVMADSSIEFCHCRTAENNTVQNSNQPVHFPSA